MPSPSHPAGTIRAMSGLGEPPRFNVLGTGVSAMSLADTRDLLVGAHGQRRLGYVCATGVHGVSEARRDASFASVLARAWLVVPDGMPLVWLGRWHGHRAITRVYGPDLMLAVCAAGRSVGLTHYLCGGDTGVAEDLRDSLVARFPGLEVVGIHTPPFRPLGPDDIEAVRADVAAQRPDIVWLGLSTPKQERLAAQLVDVLDTGALVTVGAAFDFHTGRVAQAPPWMQRLGLEWLHRLAREPRRLAPRYLVNNPLFVLRTLAQLTGLRRYPLVEP
jgi:N-acetylglucosaminyldiphosphoundecaprenol N-acetyl-beta-D-mannosaminyltransferase